MSSSLRVAQIPKSFIDQDSLSLVLSFLPLKDLSNVVSVSFDFLYASNRGRYFSLKNKLEAAKERTGRVDININTFETFYLMKRIDYCPNRLQREVLEARPDLVKSEVRLLTDDQLNTLKERVDLFVKEVLGLEDYQLLALRERSDLFRNDVKWLTKNQLRILRARKQLSITEACSKLSSTRGKRYLIDAVVRRLDMPIEDLVNLSDRVLNTLASRPDLSTEEIEGLDVREHIYLCLRKNETVNDAKDNSSIYSRYTKRRRFEILERARNWFNSWFG